MLKKTDNLGFEFSILKNKTVQIKRKGITVTVLRKDKSIKFINKINSLDFQQQQQLMARVTGNYKRGNERLNNKKGV